MKKKNGMPQTPRRGGGGDGWGGNKQKAARPRPEASGATATGARDLCGGQRLVRVPGPSHRAQARLLNSFAAITETHPKALSAVNTKARFIQSCPEASPAKATKKITPVTTEYTTHPLSFRAAKRRAKTKQTAITARNAIVAILRCTRPCQLMAVAEAGVPGGKPETGSA